MSIDTRHAFIRRPKKSIWKIQCKVIDTAYIFNFVVLDASSGQNIIDAAVLCEIVSWKAINNEDPVLSARELPAYVLIY